MDPNHYYRQVIEKVENCFSGCHYVIATGNELAGQGPDPTFPALAAPISALPHLCVQRSLQVHLPVIGSRSQSVLMPLDFEIFLEHENHTLYTDPESQRHLFKQIFPLIRLIEEFLRHRELPYLLDYTPSGAHVLFRVMAGTPEAAALNEIGFIEEDLAAACAYIDPHDIRRQDGISQEAAAMFSGLGKLAEYLALFAMQAFKDNSAHGKLPVTIADSLERCINVDNSWCEGSPFMRSIRSPFSLHKKNQEKYGFVHQPPLVDVIGASYDGTTLQTSNDIDHILACMWNLDQAAEHARQFSGNIPCANATLIELVHEYQASDLFRFHQEFEQQEELPKGAAVARAKAENRICDTTRCILDHPNPAALQPKQMINLVRDFLINADWPARHIANILRDLYQNPAHGWIQDFYRYPSEEKANFWARTYSAVALWEVGGIVISVDERL